MLLIQQILESKNISSKNDGNLEKQARLRLQIDDAKFAIKLIPKHISNRIFFFLISIFLND